MCTVLLRFAPGAPWPLLLGAVRDEFVNRAWDPPARHWSGAAQSLVGGRDATAGGTWLAVRQDPPAVAAVLNGLLLPVPDADVRPSRGGLPLAVLTGEPVPDPTLYDGYHLLRGTPDRVEVWSWDGEALLHTDLAPGDHILVNYGVNAAREPLVPHFAPLLAAAAGPDPQPGLAPEQAWGDWLKLLAGDGLKPNDPRALVVRANFGGRTYASTSACLVGLSRSAVRYDFTADPAQPEWSEVALGGPSVADAAPNG